MLLRTTPRRSLSAKPRGIPALARLAPPRSRRISGQSFTAIFLASALAFAQVASTPRSVATEGPRRRATIGWTSAKPSQPFVDLEIGGVTTHALIDTGASDHVVAQAVLDKAALPTVALRAQGVDHGAGSMTLRGLGHTAVSIPGFGPLEASLSTARDGLAFAVASVHPRFQELGLGAFVSPQRLVTAGHAIVVDLVHGELLEVPLSQVRPALEAIGPHSLFTTTPTSCTHGTGSRPGTTWMIDALVEGSPARLLVDTGAAFGDLFRDSAIGRALVTRQASTTTMITARQSLETARIDDLTVRVGDVQRSKLRWNVVESQGKPVCPYDGVLGIDVLRHCALAFDGRSVSGRCEALEDPVHAARKNSRKQPAQPARKKNGPRKKNDR